MGFDTFLENCRTHAIKQLEQSSTPGREEAYFLSSLRLHSTSLQTTLDTFLAKEAAPYDTLLKPLREQVVDAVKAVQQSGAGLDIADSFQTDFHLQETSRIQLQATYKEKTWSEAPCKLKG